MRARPKRLLGGLAAVLCVGVIAAAFVAPERPSPEWNATAAEAEPPAEVQAAREPVAAPEPVPAFRRGVNLSRLLSFSRRDPARPGHYLYPPFEGPLASMSSAEFDRLRVLGFDFVRLPVDAGPFIEAGEADSRLLFDRMRDLVHQLHRHGLSVLLDIHPETFNSRWRPEDILADPAGPKFGRYTEFLRQVAAEFRDEKPDEFALGLMNEPQPACERTDGEDWTVTQKRLFDTLRAEAPDMPLVVTGGCWSSIEGLVLLDPAQFDAATYYDVHFYEPFFFTHQSIPWAYPPAPYLAGLTYPASAGSAEKTIRETQANIARMRESGTEVGAGAVTRALEEIAAYYTVHRPGPEWIGKQFDAVADWAAGHGVDPARIVVGEFSAIRWPEDVPDDGSRPRWIADVRKTAEARGFGWSLWDYYPGFGLLSDDATRTVDFATAEALGLNVSGLPR